VPVSLYSPWIVTRPCVIQRKPICLAFMLGGINHGLYSRIVSCQKKMFLILPNTLFSTNSAFGSRQKSSPNTLANMFAPALSVISHQRIILFLGPFPSLDNKEQTCTSFQSTSTLKLDQSTIFHLVQSTVHTS